MIATSTFEEKNFISRQDLHHMFDILFDIIFKEMKSGDEASEEISTRIIVLKSLIACLNTLLANRLVEDRKEVLFLMKILLGLITRKEAFEMSLMTEEELKNLKITAENFGMKAQSSVGGARLVESQPQPHAPSSSCSLTS